MLLDIYTWHWVSGKWPGGTRYWLHHWCKSKLNWGTHSPSPHRQGNNRWAVCIWDFLLWNNDTEARGAVSRNTDLSEEIIIITISNEVTDGKPPCGACLTSLLALPKHPFSSRPFWPCWPCLLNYFSRAISGPYLCQLDSLHTSESNLWRPYLFLQISLQVTKSPDIAYLGGINMDTDTHRTHSK